ncbi:MAG: SCO family protein [Cognatishimia sp.]|uniref:SCO family protein n=1 Tax=Cognatishimia sp. TaxID=2211648 RepID=UPI0040589E2A
MRSVRAILWGAVVIAVTGILGFAAWHLADHDATSKLPEEETSVFRPTFSLTNHWGQAVSEETYQGKWLLVFFGFTNCPDICPTTLTELGTVIDRLESDAEKVVALFISIDPARDRVKDMAEYVSAFHPAIVGLSGNDNQVAQAAIAFKAIYEKQQQELTTGGYTMLHTSSVYLISPEGAFIRTYSYGTLPAEVTDDLQMRMEGY